MSSHRNIYFHEETQKVRFTQSSTDGFVYDYKYVGHASENEFNILLDLMLHLHEDDNFTYEDFCQVYKELRYFCDKIMGLVDDL